MYRFDFLNKTVAEVKQIAVNLLLSFEDKIRGMRMKKKHFAWIALLILISNLLVPFKQMYDVFADEKSTSNQTIINNTELSVDVVSTIDGEGIHWEINYDKQLKNSRSSKLKFKLIQDDAAMQFPKTENWQNDAEGNWFVEEHFTEKSKGKISFTTLDVIESLTFEIQMDEETESEDATSFVLSNVLDSKLQGPYSLKILELAKILKEEDEIDTDINEEDTENNQVKEDFSDLETDEELNQKDIDSTELEIDQVVDEKETDDTEEQEKIDVIEEQEIVPIYSSFGRGITSAQNEGARVYTDLFEYTEESIYPVHGTNNYLDSNSVSEYVSNFNYGNNDAHAPGVGNVQGYIGVKDISGGGLNFNTGYHEYFSPENVTGSSVLTKKTVKPTTDPNIFDIEVDVIGGATAVQTPIDIAFVVDRSGSMGSNTTVEKPNSTWWNRQYYTRFELLQNAVDAFADNLLDGSENVRIGLASFQSYDLGGNNNTRYRPESYISTFGTNLGFTNDKVTLMDNPIIKNAPSGGTPTFLGVSAGLELLKNEELYGARDYAKRVLIVLTDGNPTYWPNENTPNDMVGATRNPETGYQRYRLSATSNYGGTGFNEGGYTATSNRVTSEYSRLDPNNDINKYSIAFAFDSDSNVENMLTNIGTFYDASDASTISTVLEAIRRDILDYNFAIDDGQLVDPMSDYVEVVNSENISQSALIYNDQTKNLQIIPSTAENYPGYASNIQGGLQEDHSGFAFTNMNLGSANGIVRNGFRFNYQVQLKENYRDGKFYPANGPTYANGRTYENSLGFAIPSIRSETIDIPVEKIWQGDQNFKDLRQNIVFELQQKRHGETNWTAVPDMTISIPKDAEGEALKGEFSTLPAVTVTESNGTYSYHAIDYRIIEKVGSEQRVYGYKTPVISPDGAINRDTAIENRPVSITNTLLTTDLEFTKVDETGESLRGADFTLYRKVGETETLIEKTPNLEDSHFKFEGLPVGDYVLKETATPDGFEKRDDITFTIEEENIEGQVSLKVVGFPDDSTEEGIQIENKLNPFNLSILKQDTHTQKPLVGVKFLLTEKGTETVLATATSGNDGIGIFQDSEGNEFVPVVGTTYIIKETQTIDGYVLSEMTFEVTVNGDGTVIVNESEKEYETVELLESEDEENPATLIQITVNNTPKGLLPSTGGTGRQIFLIGSIAVLGMTGLIGGYYVYRNRKGAQ